MYNVCRPTIPHTHNIYALNEKRKTRTPHCRNTVSKVKSPHIKNVKKKWENHSTPVKLESKIRKWPSRRSKGLQQTLKKSHVTPRLQSSEKNAHTDITHFVHL